MDVPTPAHVHRLQQVTQSISLTLTGTAWQLKLLITIISEKMKKTWGLYPHSSTRLTPFFPLLLPPHRDATQRRISDYRILAFWHAWLCRTGFTAKGGIAWHKNEALGGIQLNWNANWFSLLNNWNDTEISLGAISHLGQSYITA